LPWLAAAASLVLAAALGLYSLNLRSRIGALELRLQEATDRATTGERRIADLRRVADDAHSQLAVLVAPDLQRIDLAGQPRAPQASARAFWSRSRGLVFTASNLPAAPAGKTYQLWVLTKQPAPISAGLFKPDPSGRVDAVFETPSDLPQPIGMAVTIEQDGGVPSPDRGQVFGGTVTQRVAQLTKRRTHDQAFMQFPGILDGGAACGVVEYTPHFLGCRNPANRRRKRRDVLIVISRPILPRRSVQPKICNA
jgi:hypothetical protein